MLDMIRSGKIKVEINPEKQNRHIKNMSYLSKVLKWLK